MKFTCTVTILQPINTVARLFSEPKTMKHCQDGFISINLISGEKGKPGTVSKLKYKKFDLIETIISNNLPNEFYAQYEHKHMTNTMKAKFIKVNENTTKYISEIHYSKFNGIFINIIAKVFPNFFKKQVIKWMLKFKAYAEVY